MLNKFMKRKQTILLIFYIFLCFLFYKIIFNTFISNNTTNVDSSDLINNEKVSPQKLYDKSWSVIKKDYIDSSCNSQNWKKWRHRYDGKLKTDEDARVAIETMVASLDDSYTRFLSNKEYLEQFNSIDSHISGIGVHIMSIAGKITVYGVMEDTPAQKSGLLANDVILEVDGKSVSGMHISKVADVVRGKVGSYVTLKIKRGNKILIKRIQRAKIEIKSVEASMRKNDIGYIKVTSFIGTNTSSDFVSALKKLEKSKSIILDLRGNTGGLLTNAVVIANLFINDGKIVSIVYKNGKKKDITAIHMPSINKPTVLLVDGTSASASEILSGALKDNKKAVLVGTKTFGKGLVQQIVPMPNGTGLNVTVAKYLTPNGTDIHKKGINPDYEVAYTFSDLKKHNDTQLKKAEEIAKSLCKN